MYGQVAAGGTHASNPTSSYDVDGAPPTMFTGAQNGSTHTQTRFFRSPPLADGPHALVVTALGAGAYFWLDFFVVEAPAKNSNNSVVNGGIPVAAVAGEILGVVIAVVLLLLAVVYVVRRRRGKVPRSEIAMEIAMSVITSASAQESTHASPSSGSGVPNEADGTSRACASVSLLDAPEGARPIPRVQGLFARALNTEQTDQAIVPASWSWGDEGESPPEYTLESA